MPTPIKPIKRLGEKVPFMNPIGDMNKPPDLQMAYIDVNQGRKPAGFGKWATDQALGKVLPGASKLLGDLKEDEEEIQAPQSGSFLTPQPKPQGTKPTEVKKFEYNVPDFGTSGSKTDKHRKDLEQWTNYVERKVRGQTQPGEKSPKIDTSGLDKNIQSLMKSIEGNIGKAETAEQKAEKAQTEEIINSMELLAMDENYAQMLKDRMLQIMDEKQKIKDSVFAPVEKRSLIEGSTFSDSLFKFAFGLVSGPIDPIYGVDPIDMIEAEADKEWERQKYNKSILMNKYQALGAELGDVMEAKQDYISSNLDVLGKKLDYIKNRQSEPVKQQMELLKQAIEFKKLKKQEAEMESAGMQGEEWIEGVKEVTRGKVELSKRERMDNQIISGEQRVIVNAELKEWQELQRSKQDELDREADIKQTMAEIADRQKRSDQEYTFKYKELSEEGKHKTRDRRLKWVDEVQDFFNLVSQIKSRKSQNEYRDVLAKVNKIDAQIKLGKRPNSIESQKLMQQGKRDMDNFRKNFIQEKQSERKTKLQELEFIEKKDADYWKKQKGTTLNIQLQQQRLKDLKTKAEERELEKQQGVSLGGETFNLKWKSPQVAKDMKKNNISSLETRIDGARLILTYAIWAKSKLGEWAKGITDFTSSERRKTVNKYQNLARSPLLNVVQKGQVSDKEGKLIEDIVNLSKGDALTGKAINKIATNYKELITEYKAQIVSNADPKDPETKKIIKKLDVYLSIADDMIQAEEKYGVKPSHKADEYLRKDFGL